MRRAPLWMTLKALVLAQMLPLTSPLHAATDYNGDGICDVWQQLYNAWSLPSAEDSDGDGSSNIEESIAGTDPRNPADSLRIAQADLVGNEVLLELPSAKGKRYQLFSSDTPHGPTWVIEGAALVGTGSTLQFTTPKGSETQRKFYRVETTDLDTDDDGINDWAEAQTGTDPALGTSPGNASGGTASDAEVLASLFSLTTTTVPSATGVQEKEGLTSRIRLNRPADKSAMRLTLAYASSGNPTPARGSASPGDFTLTVDQPSGQITGAATGSLTLPAGVSQMDVIVHPVLDNAPEVPELLTLNIIRPGSGPATPPLNGTALIRDADPTNEDNRTLFVAYLGKEAGVSTTATGIATALVQGDNDEAQINLTFSNLTSPQNTAYLRVDSDLEIINVGLGQVTGKQWQIRAAQTKFTDQAMLTALHAGQLYISITTAENPTGEIRGYFNKTTGSTSFAYNPNLHDSPQPGSQNWMNPTGEALERDIWRFLDQCTYGGTDALYQEVLAKVTTAIASGGTYLDGYRAWLNDQMNPSITPSASLLQLVYAADNEEFVLRGNKPLWSGNDPQFAGESYTVNYDGTYGTPTITTTANGTYNNNHPFHNNRRREQWTLAMQAKAQVRQRMAQALSEIVVISEMDATVQDKHYGAAAYWDMLAENAFGQYRTILENVTYSPMMGVYLSHLKNRAEYAANGVNIFPDENYAREIMQLFSIGLVLRHPDGSLVLGQNGLPIPTYDNIDIAELARVMTGLCHGARHAAVSIQRFNGLHFTASTPRVSQTIEFQGVEFTTFTEGGGDSWWQAPWIYPMKVLGRVNTITASNRPFHDFGTKTLLHNYNGGTVLTGITDAQLNALSPAQSHTRAEQELTAAHNLLAGNPASGTYNGHQNTPVNISRWLIQRFTTSNPSAGYLYRVSQIYRSSNGNLGEVLKAILLDYEARSLQLADTSISHGRMKEPLVHFMSVMRGLKAYTGLPVSALKDVSLPFSVTDSPKNTPLDPAQVNAYVANATRFRFDDSTTALGQSPLRSPSVFNWFLPDYVVPGPMAEAGVLAPELQIASETNLVNRINRLWTYTWMNLPGMTAQPGSDTGIADIPHVATNAAVQAKVAVGAAPTAAGNFATSRTLTFTPSNYSTPQTVYVAAVDDSQREGVHSTTMQHTATSTDAVYNNPALPPVSVTINDNEGSSGSVIIEQSDGITIVAENSITDTYTVKLGNAPSAPVTITANGNAHLSLSPTKLTFTNTNWNTPQTVTAAAIDDSYAGELVHLGFIGHAVNSADANYNGISAPSFTAFIGDNDQASSNGITVRHTGASTMVTEGGASDQFVVALNRQPTTANGGIVTVSISSNARVTRTPATLTFNRDTNWWIPQVVTLQSVNDAVANGTASFNLTLTSSGGGYTQSTTAAIVVNDNDGATAGGIIIAESGGNTTISESAAFSTASNDSYTIRLSSQPTQNVSVVITPQQHIWPMSNHAKLMGYFTSDTPSSTSNSQKDRVIFDYTDLMTLYNTTFTANGGLGADNAANVNAHLAATLAVVNKLDLMWCGGQMKAQWPTALTTGDLNNALLVNPRKSIVASLLYAYNTSRGSTGNPSAYAGDVRDRCRVAAYLISISPAAFTMK